MSCYARREGDEMVCAFCGVRWGVDEPQECPGFPQVERRKVVRIPDAGPVVEIVVRLPKGEARKLLDDLKAKLADSPGAKWKDKR